MTLTPIVSSSPPNPSVGESYSWIKVDNDQNRTLYSQSVFVVNDSYNAILETNDILSRLTNIVRQLHDDNGFVFVDDSEPHDGPFETLKVVSACKISGLTADNTTVGNLSNYELPVGFELNGQIYNFVLQYGAVLSYHTVDPSRFTNSIINVLGQSLITTNGNSITTING